MTTEVLTVSNRRPSEPYMLYDECRESLGKFGHALVELTRFDGMMSRLKEPLKWLHANPCEHLILIDSWDMIWLESPNEVIRRFKEFGKSIVISAERNLFPATDERRDKYPAGPTDVRYLNAGFIVAQRDAFVALLEHLDVLNLPDDYQDEDGKWVHQSEQGLMHDAFIEQFVPMTLDYASTLCQNLFQSLPGEVTLIDGRAQNTLFNTDPCVLHANGPSKTDGVLTGRHLKQWWKGGRK